MENPFSWDYLTAPLSETPTFGPFSVAYLIVFGLTFLVSAFMYYDAPRRFEHHKINRDLVRRATQWLMWVTGIGLFFFLIRGLRFEFLTFEKRIWLYLSALALLAVVGYFAYYLKTVYPQQVAAFERQRQRRQYIAPTVGRRGQAKPRRAEPAGRTARRRTRTAR